MALRGCLEVRRAPGMPRFRRGAIRRGTFGGVRALTSLPEQLRETFRARVSGDPTGAPAWVRDIARVGTGPGWFEPDGVVWRGASGPLTPLGRGGGVRRPAGPPPPPPRGDAHPPPPPAPARRAGGPAP